MWGTPTRRWIVLLLGSILLLASCGGDEGDAGGDDGSTTTSAQDPTTSVAEDTTDTTAPETSDDPAESSNEGGSVDGMEANKAVVTVGDSSYEFDVEMSVVGRCEPDFFGAFWMIAGSSDGSNSGLEMFIVPDGNTNHDETSRVSVNLQEAEGRDWRADEDGGGGVEAGVSRVESFSIDGNAVSGTVSFIDTYGGDGATAEGTFQAACPG